MIFKIINKTGLLILVLVLTGCSKTLTPKSIVVFGDSLSDQGNLLAIFSYAPHFQNIHMTTPPSSHNGRAFTNKLLAVEYLAKHYKIDLSPAWNYKKSNTDIQASIHKNKSYANTIAAIVSNSNFQEMDKNSDLRKEAEFLIETLLDKVHSTTLDGNNYAIANTTIASDYDGFFNVLFNALSLPHQIAKYKKHGDKSDIEKTLFVIMTGGNDIFNITLDQSLSVYDKKVAVSNLIPIIVNSIHELQTLGAKKILIPGLPDIGNAPAFYNKPFEQLISELSKHFNEELSKSIHQNFSKKQVKWLPIEPWLSNLENNWKPSQLKHKACVSDISNQYIDWKKLFIQQELDVKFVGNCTQQALDNGEYFYYDSVHGTNAVYEKLGKLLIQTTSKFFSQ